ncbi:MAG TPA: Crp/Fnr family transcriptional regulator [Pyrinomonadaceae bacterium]|nr:Crp/Fnr family transcriptional regulator [Pyrinomonadaceae bacterium]
MKPLLENISAELFKKLESIGFKRSYGEDQEVFARGDKADFLPIVLSGAVKMIRNPEVGKEVIIGIFRSGEMFAVPPVFDGAPYPSTAIAVEKTELLQISRSDFLNILRDSPEFAFEVIGWTCEMLREKTSMIRTLATASPEHRVGRVLIKLAEDAAALPFRVPVRRQDIAEMASLTTETTIRVIRRFANQGLVRIVHGKIFIDSLEPLQAFLRD